VLQFLRILLLNTWHGVRRANVLPAFVLMLTSVSVLLIGSSAAASGSDGATSPSANAATSTQPPSPFVIGDASSTPHVNPKPHAKPQKDGPKSSSSESQSEVSTGQPSQQSAPSEPQADQSLPAAPVLTLNSMQTVCVQGQTVTTVQSATLSLPVAASSNSTLGWYWEINGGASSPPAQPVNNESGPESISVGETQVIIPSNSSQPLLSAPAAQTSYSIRLHVLFGSQNVVSNWVTVPAAASATCEQN